MKLLENWYNTHDLQRLQNLAPPTSPVTAALQSLDELLTRDRQREADGFPRKIRVGKLVKPVQGGPHKVVVVPTTVEEKLMHDMSEPAPGEEGASGGSGEGQEGDVIGEQPIQAPDAPGAGPGQGEGESHELESNAYDLGKTLSEQFQLPNLKDKGRKRTLVRWTYDLTDRHRGFGQFLDKKATLREILETNIHLGRVPDPSAIDPSQFLISPDDMIYRILSPEKEYESQALVFFVRDYSGSMSGKPTEIIVGQHILIYSWLLYQYENKLETRFVLHDTEAIEVPDFYTYYNYKVAGGTKVASAFHLVNQLVDKDSLAQDYNIYIFYGTDGDDWDTDGKETVPAIRQALAYVNRLGITITRPPSDSRNDNEVERYLNKSNLLTQHPELIRMDIVQQTATESQLIDSIKRLIS